MKTMGIRALALVSPVDLDPEIAAITAIHAADVLEEAKTFDRLEEAIRDAVLVAGVTRRAGKRRKTFLLTPELLARRAAEREGTTAVVFGNEKDGLTDRELGLCHVAVRIPSSPLFPSLNLSHAVQILCYELFRGMSAKSFRYTPIAKERLQELIQGIHASLEGIGFFSRGQPADLGTFLEDILARAGLSIREADRVAEIFRKIKGLAAKNRPHNAT